MGTDPFEEFEFKPLTEGLGFHGKKAELKQLQTHSASLLDDGVNFTDELDANPFKTPLPRKETLKAKETLTPAISPVDDILQNLKKTRKLEIENDQKQRAEFRRQTSGGGAITWTAGTPSLSAIILDGLLISAAGLLCMIVMLVITKADLLRNLANPDTEGLVYASTAGLFAAVYYIYMTCNRLFLGFTPGEWAYDMRTGTPEQQPRLSYLPRVLLRQTLVLVTGGILLPIVSLITKTDWAGRASGVVIQKKS